MPVAAVAATTARKLALIIDGFLSRDGFDCRSGYRAVPGARPATPVHRALVQAGPSSYTGGRRRAETGPGLQNSPLRAAFTPSGAGRPGVASPGMGVVAPTPR